MGNLMKIWRVLATLALAATAAAAQGASPGTLKTVVNKAAEAKAATTTAGTGAVQKESAFGSSAKPKAGSAAALPPPRGYAGKQVKDPFLTPSKPMDQNVLPTVLPPGKRGLVIAQSNLQGVVKTPGGPIAVMASSNGRTYFLRPKDEVFNGRVTRITDDSIAFEEQVIDTEGHRMKRETVKKLPAEVR